MYLLRKIGVFSRKHCCRGKGKINTYSQRVFLAPFMHHAKRKRRIILESVVCPAVLYFSALPHTIFGKWLLSTRYVF